MPGPSVRKRRATLSDNLTWERPPIDAFGVPRVVPDDYKLVDQVDQQEFDKYYRTFATKLVEAI